jgi:predicted DNA-binding transcriptional regulator AlpA
MQEVSQSTISKRPRLDSATYSMSEVCGLFDLGYTTLWTQVQAGTFPVTPIKVGRIYKFPKRTVDRLLGLDDVAEPQDAA